MTRMAATGVLSGFAAFLCLFTAIGADETSGADLGASHATVERVVPPATILKIGKPRRDARRGTARLPVRISNTGTLQLRHTGRVRSSVKHTQGPSTVRLNVVPRGSALKALRRTGHTRVRTTVQFTSAGGVLLSKSRMVGLRLKRR